MRIFCIAKDSHVFSTINISVFDNVVGIYLTSWGWLFEINDIFS